MRALAKSLPLLQSGLFRGLGAASQLALAWWVSQSLTKLDAGEFLFYLSCFTVLSPVLLFGTQQYAMRHLSQFEAIDSNASDAAYQLMRMNLSVIAWVSVVSITIAVIWDNWSDSFETIQSVSIGPTTWLVLSSVLAGVSLVVASHFHGVRRLGSSIFFSHICLPMVTVAMFSLAKPMNSHSAIECHVTGSWITSVFALLYWRLVFPNASKSDGASRNLSNTVTSKEVIEHQGPEREMAGQGRAGAIERPFAACRDFWLLNAFQLAMNWSPLIVAGFLVAGEELAELNVAQRAANLINFLLIVVSFAFTPKFRLYWTRNDLDGLRKVVGLCSMYLFVIGTPVAFAVIVGAPFIMSGFGDDYRNGATLLCIFAAGQYFNVITGSVNQILTMCNHESTLRNICLLSATVSLSVGSLLIWQYGEIGAAIGVAVALTLQNVLAVLAVRKLLGFWVFQWRTPMATKA